MFSANILHNLALWSVLSETKFSEASVNFVNSMDISNRKLIEKDSI